MPRLSLQKLRKLLADAGIPVLATDEKQGDYLLSIDVSGIARRLRNALPVVLLRRSQEKESLSLRDLSARWGISPMLPVLVVLADGMRSQRSATDRPNGWIISTASDVIGSVETGTARWLRRLLVEQLGLAQLAPYQANSPVDDRMFFGRRTELEELSNGNTSCVIVGPRRIGKSSLALHLTRLLSRDRGYRVPLTPTSERYLHSVAYVDLSLFEAADANAAWDALLRNMGVEHRDLQGSSRVKYLLGKRAEIIPRTPFEVLLHLCRFKYQMATLVFDEVDQWIDKDREQHWSFFGRLRALTEDARSRTRVVLSGSVRLLSATADRSFPLFWRTKRISLQGLDLPSVERLVTEPMRELGVRFRERRRCVRSIYEATGGLPNLAQELCRAILSELSRRRRLTVTPQLVDEVLKGEDSLTEVVYRSFTMASPLAQLLAFTAAREGGFSPVETASSLRERFAIDVDTRDVRSATEALAVQNILRQSGERYVFTSGLLRSRLLRDLDATGHERLLFHLAEDFRHHQHSRSRGGVSPSHQDRAVVNVFGDRSKVNWQSVDLSESEVELRVGRIITKIRSALEQYEDGASRKLMRELDELERSVSTPRFWQRYRSFVELAANHAEVLGPLVKALGAAVSG